MPRSLKEPVGLAPSTLIQTSPPVSSESHGLSTSGVPPSRSVKVGVPSGSGSQSRYSSITPRHWCRGRCPLVGAHSASPSTRITEDTSRTSAIVAQRLDRGRQRLVGGAVGDHDELGVVAAALLADGLDRDVVLGEGLRDRGEHAGAVVDVDRDVVAGAGAAPSAAPRRSA